MRIFTEKVIFRLKRLEYSKFENIMKKENMSMSDAGRLLFYLGLNAYQEAQKSSSINSLENQERTGRQLSADEDLKPSFAQQEAQIQG